MHRMKRLVFKLNEHRIKKRIVAASERAQNFFFVQVGSNDGISGDPIHALVKQHHWKGILIEPVRYLYEKLVANYEGCHGLSFENAAVDKENGKKNFYYIRSVSGGGRMAWYEKLGSFSKEHALKHRDKIPDFDARLVEELVPCITFANVCRKYGVEKIDLLHIDAEGYDFEIIKTVPFDSVKPRMILYENKHLSAGDKSACKQLLRSRGYKFIKSKDTFAYL